MLPINRPSSSDNQPLDSHDVPTPATTVSPKKISAKISIGPKVEIANSAIGSVATIMRMADRVPPIAEQVTAKPIALPAWPFWVMG